MHSTTAACCLSIVLDSSVFHTIRLSLFILDFLRQGTHIRQLCIQLHWNLTTLRISRSRPRMLRRFYHARLSTGRKYHYPICLSSPSLYLPYKVRVLKSFLGVCSCSLSILNSRRKVSDVLIFCFQGSQRYKITPSLYLPLSERVDNHKNKKFLIFYDFFKFFKDAMLPLVHCHL